MIAAARAASAQAGWPRRVVAELLDELPPDDPRALRSRRDLRLVNRIMGHSALLARALDDVMTGPAPRLVELGAGDGTLLERLARRRARRWPHAAVTLLDAQPTVTHATLAALRDLGWTADVVAADALEWLERSRPDRDAVVVANLFVHHFEGERLARLLAGVAAQATAFVCCEPRRARLALAGSHLLWAIGCNDVTRHDAVVSVHAGFRDRELTAEWRRAAGAGWTAYEKPAGAFSHLFVARRAP
ncbi:MAG TPA: methyltransferase domain-containing protein [Gammaproteobacteria bacterium]|nr:methyltransferase domain-containing protein [Gammaproteobacteria bacterium]